MRLEEIVAQYKKRNFLLVVNVIFLFLSNIDLSQRETTAHIGQVITTEQNNGLDLQQQHIQMSQGL